MNEYEYQLKNLIKQIDKTMAPISIAVSKFSNVLKPITDFFEELNIKLKPFYETIDREYNVDKEKYDSSIQDLCNKGFYLPIFSTPRLYIEINSFSNEQLEVQYIQLFENEDKNITYQMDIILSTMEELVHPDWEHSIKQSIQMIRDNGIDKTYNLFLPLYFCYLEFIIRDKLPLKGHNIKGFGNLFNDIKKSIHEDSNYTKSQKEFFSVIATSTFKNYYKFAKGEGLNIVSRNSLFHGFIGADKVRKIDFYKQIALLTQFIYFLKIYDKKNG